MTINFFKKIALAGGIACFSAALCFAILAWNEPDAAPPNGNVAAPLNTGAVTQSKTGKLNVMGIVGIGTTSPDASTTLDVNGDAKAGSFCLGTRCCSNWAECFCTPNACAAGTCGSMTDSCGGTQNCGACSAGKVCYHNNCCGPSCHGACGTVSDGCGGTIYCGSCCSPHGCNGACGTVSDGCGGTIYCGSCSPPPQPSPSDNCTYTNQGCRCHDCTHYYTFTNSLGKTVQLCDQWACNIDVMKCCTRVWYTWNSQFNDWQRNETTTCTDQYGASCPG